MESKTLRHRLLNGEETVGTFQTIDSPIVAEIIGNAGMDFVILDQEHGPLTAETCLGLCTAVERGGASPVVRVRSNTEAEIQRALDIGAAGVEVPQVETKTDAEQAVNAARFAPTGERGLSPYVRAGAYDGGPQYTEIQNEETAVIVHIEGERGIENLDDIMAIDGIDVLFLGPYDLSQSLGIPGEVDDDRVEELMAEVCERADDADIVVGTYADDVAMAERWREAGAQYVAIGVDAPIFSRAVETLVDSFES